MSGETVTVHRWASGGTDAHGNTTDTWTDATVDGVAVSPRQGEESGNNRDAVIVGLTLYFPAGTDLSAKDEVTVRGSRCQIIGEPGVWINPYTGVTRGVQAAVERVEG